MTASRTLLSQTRYIYRERAREVCRGAHMRAAASRADVISEREPIISCSPVEE